MDSGCLSLLLVLTNIVNVRIYSLQGAVGNLSKDTDQIGSLATGAWIRIVTLVVNKLRVAGLDSLEIALVSKRARENMVFEREKTNK
jgi:hypothetical protein